MTNRLQSLQEILRLVAFKRTKYKYFALSRAYPGPPWITQWSLKRWPTIANHFPICLALFILEKTEGRKWNWKFKIFKDPQQITHPTQFQEVSFSRARIFYSYLFYRRISARQDEDWTEMEASGERIRDKNRDRETKTGAEGHGCCSNSRISWRTLLVQDASRNIKDK